VQLSKIRLKNRWQLRMVETDTDLYIDLLCSMRKGYDALKAAEGDHTNF
jgi:hypothetical protein